ncbi:hypothetical protein [Streptococcus loxodontisalivarius]|uniref:ABC transporter permease n=1 Tax=Streptococcus loxodontisalivarius TaxID=1349415 RepID=A0ABS2PTJ9_9STRE|nr:hypothetical protein [Streptococcus loxodontisalivarius]MBM7643359.1 hypothetical protein [Streptococcus loxodontisalivarius]
MLSIFTPVFESVWKRKETKIFLAFAILFPTLFFATTFAPKGSNFMVPTVYDGYLMSYVAISSLIFDASVSFILPTLALFYLTFTVFRGEVDSHTMFLYKDINRRSILGAKLLSLFMIIVMYMGLFLLIMCFYYYIRIGHMDYATMTFWDHIDPTSNTAFIHTVLTGIFDMIVSVLLAACLSLYKGVGVTMTFSFVYSIGSAIAGVLGFSWLFPRRDVNFLYDGGSLAVSLGTSTLVTLIYASLLVFLSLKFFKRMEY